MGKKVYTYDSLLGLDPYIHEVRARAYAEGLQRVVIRLVEVRFPVLIGLAGERAVLLNKPDDLTRLIEQIAVAPDEAMARWVLDNY